MTNFISSISQKTKNTVCHVIAGGLLLLFFNWAISSIITDYDSLQNVQNGHPVYMINIFLLMVITVYIFIAILASKTEKEVLSRIIGCLITLIIVDLAVIIFWCNFLTGLLAIGSLTIAFALETYTGNNRQNKD